MSERQLPICIVGAGQAGGELATSLRRHGHAGPIILLGAERHPPYQRPPLSKAFLQGALDVSTVYIKQQAAYEKAGIELRLHAPVARIDAEARRIALQDGSELAYSKLALTTGGRAKQLRNGAADSAGFASNVHHLRTIEDAQRLRLQLCRGRRLVIIGGGYIGLEVASCAVALGLLVTVLEAQPRVLARVTAPELSRFYEQIHREAGVEIRTGIQVSSWEASRCEKSTGEFTVTSLQLSDGAILPVDLVLVGIGLEPSTELAQSAGLSVDGGIVVDEYASTSDPHIVAAGDCTSRVVCGRRARIESVPNAIEQARVAAASLVGKPRASDAVPWFWSDQYDQKLQMAGLSSGHDEVVVRGSMSARSFAAFYLKEGRLIACDAVNRPREFMIARRLIAQGCSAAPATLADDSEPLEQLAAGRLAAG